MDDNRLALLDRLIDALGPTFVAVAALIWFYRWAVDNRKESHTDASEDLIAWRARVDTTIEFLEKRLEKLENDK